MESYKRIVRNTVDELSGDEVRVLADNSDGKHTYAGTSHRVWFIPDS
jgi:hypothetical protein